MLSEIPWVLTFAAVIASGTPLVFAGLGTLISERVGVVNLGVEGMMLMGAVSAVATFKVTGSVETAFIMSGLTGLASALLLCVITITFRSNQIVAGLAITIFLSGLSVFLGSLLAEDVMIPIVPPLPVPGLSMIPVLGEVFFDQNVYVYLSWACAIALSAFLFRTRSGVIARSLGENPGAAAALGVNVTRLRYLYVSLGGFLIGLGGGYIAIAILGYWTGLATVGGLGWIAIALVIFASWRPLRLLLGAYVFGLIFQLNFAFQAAGSTPLPASILAMLPYLLTILLLAVLSAARGSRLGSVPAALGAPFLPGER